MANTTELEVTTDTVNSVSRLYEGWRGIVRDYLTLYGLPLDNQIGDAYIDEVDDFIARSIQNKFRELGELARSLREEDAQFSDYKSGLLLMVVAVMKYRDFDIIFMSEMEKFFETQFAKEKGLSQTIKTILSETFIGFVEKAKKEYSKKRRIRALRKSLRDMY